MNAIPRLLLPLAAFLALAGGEAPPAISTPVLFNTPEADRLLALMHIFPPTNAWHEDISRYPVHPDSRRLIDSVGAAKHLACNRDMAFVIVPAQQPRLPVRITDYPGESDPGPFPVPANAPIEGWPMEGGTLEHIQHVGDGDRHLLILDPSAGRLHEFWQARLTPSGWSASCAATFDLTGNRLRPAGWTSSDAAGLPILPATVRYDECERGAIDHALRFTVRRSRKACIYPATHHAGHTTDAGVPAMGQRFRLKAATPIDHLPRHAQAIAAALKRYGMLVADNGGDWRISVAPDSRIQGLEALTRLTGNDFEVVVTTGENQGPRAAHGAQ